jgi:hypothetical protein
MIRITAAIAVIAASSVPAVAGTKLENCEAFKTIAEQAYEEYRQSGDEMALLRKWADKNIAAVAAANNGTNAVKQGLSKEEAGRRAFGNCMSYLD